MLLLTDMDGFKLLETVGLELDLPVISEHAGLGTGVHRAVRMAQSDGIAGGSALATSFRHPVLPGPAL